MIVIQDLRRAFERGETIEYRDKGSDGFWFLGPPTWDETRFEYRPYQPLSAPEVHWTEDKKRAVEMVKKRIEELRARDQAWSDSQQFEMRRRTGLDSPPPWLAWALAILGIGCLTWLAWAFTVAIRP